MSNILLIEPDRVLAESYYRALTAAGHLVVVVPSAQTGIMIADEINPEVIVLELQLIEHSGIEFLYELRSYVDWQNVPVIIHSHVPPGKFSGNWSQLHDHLGVAAYLYKPRTSLKELVASVTEQLQPA